MKSAAAIAALFAASCALAQDAGNLFNDPLMQVTSGVAQCPAPRGPYITAEQARVQQHVRSQHGNSCYRSGRCRLPNTYLYDAEIIPRVATYLRASGLFDDTSLWILGERRIVSVYGCVNSKEQAIEVERAIAHVDDVMNVVPFVMVGSEGKPPYRVKGDTAPD